MVNRYIVFLLLVLAGCFGGQDAVEFRGLDDRSSGQSTTPANEGRSIVSSLSVDDNKLHIKGTGLDLVDQLSLYSELGRAGVYSAVWPSVVNLVILQQDSETIIATGRDEEVNLFFDGRYDLIRQDFNSPVEDAFPFVVVRKEKEVLPSEKISSDIKLEARHLLPQGEDRDVVIYSDVTKEWTTGPITGQLEYIGSWDAIVNQSNSPKFDSIVGLAPDGTDLGINPEPGQYFVVNRECYIFDSPTTTPDAIGRECPFDSASNIVEGQDKYKVGDWLVYDGSIWHYINNHSEVESFNGRIGLIESCPNPNCPNVYDYNWDLLNKDNSKLSDLADVSEPTSSEDQYVLKVVNGVLSLEADSAGLSEVKSVDIIDETLVNEDFNSGIGLDKFKGLEDEVNSYVKKVPPSGTAEITGDLDFQNSELSGVSNITTSSGNFEPTQMKTDLEAIDPSSKLDKIDATYLQTGKHYLSSDGNGSYEWKLLNTVNLLEGATNFYFDAEKNPKALAPSDLGTTDGAVEATDTLKVAFKKLAKKKETYLAQSGAPVLLPRSVTLDKLKTPLDSNGVEEKGILYFDANNASWSFMDISGFNFFR